MGIDGRERGRRARLGYLSSGPRVPSDVTDRHHMPSATVSMPCFKPATVATRSHVYHLHKICITETYHTPRSGLFCLFSDVRTYSHMK